MKSSARSALTEGSESKFLFSKHLEVKVGCKSHARSAQAKVSLSRETEQSSEGLLLRVHAESKEARTVEVFAGLPQGVRAENLVEVEVVESSGGVGVQG